MPSVVEEVSRVQTAWPRSNLIPSHFLNNLSHIYFMTYMDFSLFFKTRLNIVEVFACYSTSACYSISTFQCRRVSAKIEILVATLKLYLKTSVALFLVHGTFAILPTTRNPPHHQKSSRPPEISHHHYSLTRSLLRWSIWCRTRFLKRYCSKLVLLKKWELLEVIKRFPESFPKFLIFAKI